MSRLWSEEEDSLLKEICASGERISAPKIAIRLSKTFSISPPRTKAAVVGRARRLKIELPLPCDRDRKGGFLATAGDQHNVLSFPLKRATPRSVEPEPRQRQRGKVLPEHPRARGVYLLNSSDDECKRPINDPAAGQRHLLRVCGEPVVRRPYGGVGYCEACLGRMLTRETNPSPGGFFVLPTKQRG